MASKESELRVLAIWIVGLASLGTLFGVAKFWQAPTANPQKVPKAKSAAIVERLERKRARQPDQHGGEVSPENEPGNRQSPEAS